MPGHGHFARLTSRRNIVILTCRKSHSRATLSSTRSQCYDTLFNHYCRYCTIRDTPITTLRKRHSANDTLRNIKVLRLRITHAWSIKLSPMFFLARFFSLGLIFADKAKRLLMQRDTVKGFSRRLLPYPPRTSFFDTASETNN